MTTIDLYNTFTPSTWTLGLAVAFVALLLIRLLFFQLFYRKPIRWNNKILKGKIKLSDKTPPVSIIIYPKFGSGDLNHIDRFMEQDYPNFEVIYILEGYRSIKEPILDEYKAKYPNLYFTFVPSDSKVASLSKLALSVGIKAANNDWILLTQAHCYPNTTHWIRRMLSHVVGDTRLVIGNILWPIKQSQKNSFWVSHYSLWMTQVFAFASQGKAFMGFGANLLFRKEDYLSSHQLKARLYLKDGEDDIFVNEISNRKNTQVEFSENGSVRIHDDGMTSWLYRVNHYTYLQTDQYLKQRNIILQNFLFGSDYLFLLVAVGLIVSVAHQAMLVGIVSLLILFKFLWETYIFNQLFALFSLPRAWTVTLYAYWYPIYNEIRRRSKPHSRYRS